MPNVAVLNMQGKEVGNLNLKDEIFGVEIKVDLMHLAVLQQLANKRQGTHSTKTRGQVRGGGAKPWRQKGTGRARQGSRRSPNWPGGGIVFGPQPRTYGFKLNKKVKRYALKSALSVKAGDNNIVVLDELTLSAPKTKDMVALLNNLKIEKKALFVTAGLDTNVVKSTNNIPGVMTLEANSINVYDILNHNTLVLTKDAVAKIEEVYI